MINIDYLRECFSYDHRKGQLIWLARPVDHFISGRIMKIFNSLFSGKEAGTIRKSEIHWKIYRSLSLTIERKRITIGCHRIAYALYHGAWADNVDHFDGNPLNNAISNLRPVSTSLNGRNKLIAKHNTSGIPGVSKHGNRWVAQGAGCKEYLGRFSHLFEAACARKSYEIKNGYTARHGRMKIPPVFAAQDSHSA